MRSCGWKPDTDVMAAGVRPLYAAKRLEAPPVVLPRKTSNLAHLCEKRDQFGSSACVGFGFTGAIHTRLRFLGYDPETFSAALPYKVGRMLGRFDKHERLVDGGSYPALVARSIRTYGLCLEREHPFNERTINEEPDLLSFSNASRFRLQAFHRITETGQARLRRVMECLAEGEPVPLGMQVGDEFQEYRSNRDPIGVETENTGGHMVYAVDYEDDGDVIIGCNSWGTDWGDDGMFRMSSAKLMHSSTSDLYHVVVAEAA